MVDSTPTGQGPASITMSMRPRRSASTCAALVGETWPELLADGATTGPSKAASNACATGCAGTRTATLSRPASARSATAAVGPLRQHQRQRSRPERGGEFFGVGIEAAEPPRGGDAADMGDQRIESSAGPWRHRAGPRPRRCGRRRRARRRSRSGRRPARRRKAARRSLDGVGGSACKTRVPGSAVIRLALKLAALDGPGVIRPAISRSVAQSGSAPRSGRGGRRFKSCHSDQLPSRGVDLSQLLSLL